MNFNLSLTRLPARIVRLAWMRFMFMRLILDKLSNIEARLRAIEEASASRTDV